MSSADVPRRLMDLNFLLRGLLSLVAVRALVLATRDQRENLQLRLGLRLLAVWAIASGLLAFFPDDLVGTPTRWRGEIHLVVAFVAFLAVLVGALMVSHALRSIPRWAQLARPLTIIAWGALIPLLLLGHSHFRRSSLGGLYEKIFLGVDLVWLLVAAAAAARTSG